MKINIYWAKKNPPNPKIMKIKIQTISEDILNTIQELV